MTDLITRIMETSIRSNIWDLTIKFNPNAVDYNTGKYFITVSAKGILHRYLADSFVCAKDMYEFIVASLNDGAEYHRLAREFDHMSFSDISMHAING